MEEPTPVDAIEYYYEHPYDFVVDLIGAIPTEQQKQVLETFPKTHRVAIRAANGVGKTALEAWLILWFMYTHPHCRVIGTAPTQHQLYDVLWPELNKWLNKSELKKFFGWTATTLYVKKYSDTWFAVARSSTEATNFQGFHEESIMFLVDEASGVSDSIWEAIRGSLTTSNSYAILCGNPNYIEGFFYNAFNKNSSLWTKFHFNSLESPIVTKESIQEIILESGEDSSEYRIRVLGEFPLEDASDLYLPHSLIKYAVVDYDKVWEEIPNPDFEYDLGLDPAREGSDEATFIISKHNVRHTLYKTIEIVHAKALAKSDGPQLMNEVIIFDNKWRFQKIYPDETGMGGYLYDFMKKLSNLPVVPITFNKRAFASGPLTDSNKEAMYKSLKLLFERQKQQCLDKERGVIEKDRPDIFLIPNIPKLVTQLATMKYEVNYTSHRLSISHPPGGHDDWADSLALSLFRYVKAPLRKGGYTVA